MEDVGTRFSASAPTTGTPTSASAPTVNTSARIPTPARSSAALVVCAYGWGKELRLYADYLLVDSRHYLLQELLHVRCACRTVLGVPSASLELHFKSKKLTLRGIAAIDDASRIVEYITPWCKSPDTTFHERDTRPVETPLPGGPRRGELRMGKEKSWRWPETEKRYAQVDTMPVVAVPVLLARGEGAHYSTPATLCGEHIQETWRSTYPAQDHGLLILTDRRIIYIGRKSQLVLDYARLLHVSRLRGAIAFEAEHWQKRVIFAVPRPDECAACVETIARALKQEEPGKLGEG
ncbi:MAG TPA: hypothetical protein VIZ18_09630 [Ktedonobacteraceae bacterium]